MKTKSFLALALCAAAFTFQIPAAEPAPATPPSATLSDHYRSGEFSFATYATLDLESVIGGDAQYGGGVGVDYFFTRGFGLGLRAEATDTEGHAIDQLGPRLTVRAPLWDRLAPYGYVQGIFHLERDDWRVGTGAGVEYRFTRLFGAFAEAGADMDLDGQSRLRSGAGVRLSF